MRSGEFHLVFACGLLAFLFLAAVACNGASAHGAEAQRETAVIVVSPQQKSAALPDFAWLAGRWEGRLGAPGSDKQMTAEQEWMAPKNGTMRGFFRLTDNERTIVIELFTMRETTS